jgi:hypothetical protein
VVERSRRENRPEWAEKWKDGKSVTAVVLEEEESDLLQAGRPQDAGTAEKAIEMYKGAVTEAATGLLF